MANRLEAAIFDMDGLLLDTESIALDCWMQAASELGMRLDPAAVVATLGWAWEATQQFIVGSLDDGSRFTELSERTQALYRRRLTDGVIPRKPGAEEILRMLRDIGAPAGLATSTAREHAEHRLRSAGILQYLAGGACGDEVSRSKPEPDIFLLAARNIGVKPELCAALEDSPAGIRAAKAAGMTTIMVPDLAQPDGETLKYADYVVEDLYEAGKLLLKLFGIHSC